MTGTRELGLGNNGNAELCNTIHLGACVAVNKGILVCHTCLLFIIMQPETTA